jgi:hypothetical protein
MSTGDRESPTVEWMQRMRAAFMGAITENDMRDLAKNLMERAKKGDKEALRLVLTYAMPAPAQTTEHRRLSVQARAAAVPALPHRNGKAVGVTAEEEDA